MLGAAARIAVVVVLAAGLVGGAAAPARSATLAAGLGFDTCSAPALSTMQAWLASPYRSVGIYLGGANRACPDGNLSTAWTANVVAAGWTLLPLYVGLQAPCVSQPGLALINPSAASSQGAAAADDAAARASFFGLRPGSPVYFDMEGYSRNASCTQAVQTFLAAWSARLRADGYVPGVYGSAASTMRDLLPLADAGTGPDAAWIANWNKSQSVFGDPYVPDSYWPSHQRVHQYTGGHRETYGGVTVNIDADAVDGPAVGAAEVGAAAPPPPAGPQAGSVTTSDGAATVAWPGNAFTSAATVTATPSTLSGPQNGFAAGGYVVRLDVRSASGKAVTRFSAPVTVTFHAPPGGAVAFASANGTTWRALPLASGGTLPRGATAGYALGADGSLVVSTLVPGSIGLLQDVAPPTSPDGLRGRFVRGRLLLTWTRSTDNSGSVASYEIRLNGQPLASAAGASTSTSVRSFVPHGVSVFRVAAQDAAGNVGDPSTAVVVKPTPRPRSLPKAIPAWAFQLAAWQQSGKAGKRPKAPRAVPAWYWRWEAWRRQPFRVTRGGG